MFVIYFLSIAVEAIPKAVWFELITLAAYVEYLNSDLIINIWKKKTEMEKESEELGWSRDVKLC